VFRYQAMQLHYQADQVEDLPHDLPHPDHGMQNNALKVLVECDD
jgi:hypothetical protein